MAASGVKIGVEVELLLRLREQPQKGVPNLRAFANGLVRNYNSKSNPTYPRMHSDLDGNYHAADEYSEWSVTDDVTITDDLPNHCMQSGLLAEEPLLCVLSVIRLISILGPLEIISPIMTFGTDSLWRAQVEEVWRIIDAFCVIETDQTCGTHVHISPPGNLTWDTESLKSICCSIIWFESAFEVLVPQTRRGNEWAKSNRFDNPKFQGKTGEQCLQLVTQCSDNANIVNLMNNNGDRYYGWNFTNLYYDRKMTIEFRRGPGVTEVDECLGWVELTASFVRAAKSFGTPTTLPTFTRDVEGLKNFIQTSVVQGMNVPRYMTPIFEGKSGSLEPCRVGHLTPEKQLKLAQKKDQDQKKNLMVKKLLSYSAQ